MALQETLQEVTEKEVKFQKLVEDASDPTAIEEGVANQLYESWVTLRDTVMTLIEGRRDSFNHCDTYHKQLMELTGHVDAAAAATDDMERSRDAELGDKLAQMEVTSLLHPVMTSVLNTTALWVSCCARTNARDIYE